MNASRVLKIGTIEADARSGADEQAPAVTHEQARAVAIPIQEPEERPGEAHEQQRHARAHRRAEQESEEDRRDQPDARREAVHVVEQVHRVTDARKPDGGHERVLRRNGAFGLDAGKREHEEGADRQRRHQLGERRKLQPVVEHADDEHRQRRRHQGRPRRDRRDDFRTRGDNQEAGHGANRDGNAAHRRRGRGVPAIGPRRDDGADGGSKRRTRAPPATVTATATTNAMSRLTFGLRAPGSGLRARSRDSSASRRKPHVASGFSRKAVNGWRLK